jgi:hypothetical protein
MVYARTVVVPISSLFLAHQIRRPIARKAEIAQRQRKRFIVPSPHATIEFNIVFTRLCIHGHLGQTL